MIIKETSRRKQKRVNKLVVSNFEMKRNKKNERKIIDGMKTRSNCMKAETNFLRFLVDYIKNLLCFYKVHVAMKMEAERDNLNPKDPHTFQSKHQE